MLQASVPPFRGDSRSSGGAQPFRVRAQSDAEARRQQFVQMLARRLDALAPLGDDDHALLADISFLQQSHAIGWEFSGPDGASSRPRLIVSGWACQMRILADGRRQIFGLFMPGDALGLRGGANPVACTTFAALTAMETVDASVLTTVLQDPPPQHTGLVRALRLSAHLEEAALLDHLVRLGRQSAYERMAHLMLELGHRMERVGVSGRFPLPLTQEHLADALGLSIVHVNRTLRYLRRDGLLIVRRGMVEIRHAERLSEIAEFVPPVLAQDGRRLLDDGWRADAQLA